LGIEIPRVLVIELGLQIAHLGKQLVVIGIGAGEFFTDRVEPVEQCLRLRDAVFDVTEHRLAVVQLRLLRQNTDGVARREVGLAVARLLDPRHDLEHARLARAIRPDDTDLGAGQE
jgi:hypothetical protein